MPPATKGRGGSGSASVKDLVKSLPRRERISVEGGTELLVLVLSCNRDDTIAVDLASGALVRLRVPWPEEHEPDLTAFDVVQATLAADPERDDLAQPEAATVEGLPRQVGTLRGRRVRHMLQRLAAPPTAPSSASPDRPPPTGTSGACGPPPRSSCRHGGPSSSGAPTTTRPGRALAGTETMSGSRSKTPWRPGRSTPRARSA